jgi:hypothetical protein
MQLDHIDLIDLHAAQRSLQTLASGPTVAVARLGRHEKIVAMALQPGRQAILGSPVGSGNIDVIDPRREQQRQYFLCPLRFHPTERGCAEENPAAVVACFAKGNSLDHGLTMTQSAIRREVRTQTTISTFAPVPEIQRDMLRFNHMELTLPPGHLTRDRAAISSFYNEIFDFECFDVPIFEQQGLLLRTDPETSQFLLVTEQEEHVRSPGYDHLGFLCENRGRVDEILAACKRRQASEPEIQIKEYDDLVIGPTTVHAFYVRHLLPIWFDVQVIEYADGSAPQRDWHFG